MSLKATRRDLLKYIALAGAGTVLASCAPKAEPTKAPAAAAPAKEPVAAPAKKIELRYMERAGALGDFMRYASRLYEEKNPNITVKNEPAGWGDLTTKVPTMVAAGTMADLAFQHGAYMLPQLGKKGAWLDMTPAAERDNHDFDIYYQWALNTCRLGPKDELVAMPMGVHGGQNEFMWNTEMLKEMGVDEPNPEMGLNDLNQLFVDIQAKMPENGFAVLVGVGDHFNMEWKTRSFGHYIVGPERKQCGYDHEKSQMAHKWAYDLVNDMHVTPTRGEAQQGNKEMFYGGMAAIVINCSANYWVGFDAAVEGKFTMGHCVWPHGEGLEWGTVPSCDATVIYGKTKYPDESWALAKMLSSFEVSKHTALMESHMTPGAVIAAWEDPEVGKVNPCYKNCADAWATLPLEKWGNLGVPYNTRRQEFDDMYNNEWQKMLYGDVPFDQANVDKLQKELQAIMDKPVP